MCVCVREREREHMYVCKGVLSSLNTQFFTQTVLFSYFFSFLPPHENKMDARNIFINAYSVFHYRLATPGTYYAIGLSWVFLFT